MLKHVLRPGIAALAITTFLTGSVSGGVASARVAHANLVTQIAIATPEKATDYGWNQQGIKAARQVATGIGAKLVVNDGIGYNNTESVLRRLATSGAKFVIAQASGYSTIAPRIAQQYKVPMICYDTPANLVKGYMADIETASQQGSYLAGVLAAKTTKTGTIGIVISAGDVNWFKQAGGFIAGARSVKHNVKILFAQIGPAAYDDAPGGKRVAKIVIAGGADVVFGMGDGASFGYLNAVENARVGHKVWFIDVIGNKTPIDRNQRLLSSVLWNFRTVFHQAVQDINNGTYGTHNYNLTAKTGISLLHSRHITSTVWHLLERDRHMIIAGTLHIPLTATEAQVRALLHK